MGVRCLKRGFGVYWHPYSLPYLLYPNGTYAQLPVENYVPQLPSELDGGVTLDPRDVPAPWETKVVCPVAGAEEGSSGDVDSSSASSDSEDSSEAGTGMDAEEAVTQPEGSSRQVAPPGQEERDEMDADDKNKDAHDAKDDVPEFKQKLLKAKAKEKAHLLNRKPYNPYRDGCNAAKMKDAQHFQRSLSTRSQGVG